MARGFLGFFVALIAISASVFYSFGTALRNVTVEIFEIAFPDPRAAIDSAPRFAVDVIYSAAKARAIAFHDRVLVRQPDRQSVSAVRAFV